MIGWFNPGPLYPVAWHWLAVWLAVTAAVAAAVLALAHGLFPATAPAGEPPAHRAVTAAFERMVGPRDWILFTVACAAGLLALDGAAFHGGFFRCDDFALLGDVRATPVFSRYLHLIHNDHAQPLYLAEVWTLVALAGRTATPGALAAVFNAASFAAFLGLLLAGGWALHELGARRLTLAGFAGLLWLWPGWGEFTAGYYCLGIYPRTVLWGFVALALTARAARTGAAWCGPAAAGALLAASATDISGLWTIPVLAGFGLALLADAQPATGWRVAGYLGGASALALCYHLWWAPHALAGRELVQNPSGRLVVDSVWANLRHYGWTVGFRMFTGLGGVILSFLVPPTFAVLAVQHGHDPRLWIAFSLAEAAALTAWVLLGASAWRHSDRPDRRLLGALGWAVLVPVAMVALARANLTPVPATLWPAKYQCIPWCWFAFGAAVGLDRQRCAGGADRILLFRRVLVGLAAGLWLAVSCWQFEKKLALNEPWLAGGRYHNVVLAQLRRADFALLLQDLTGVARRVDRYDLPLPPPSGRSPSYRFLEFGGSVERGANYAFPDLLAVAPRSGLTVRLVDRDRVPPPVLAALRDNARLATLFLAEP